ncbi:Putative ubiquinone biosynthesis monooxygenase [Malassezia sp. CBS 17886]|nr:Putative ubiquinone biosynthesis monooxygenase [Malassezia sp. CBS 17886]
MLAFRLVARRGCEDARAWDVRRGALGAARAAYATTTASASAASAARSAAPVAPSSATTALGDAEPRDIVIVGAGVVGMALLASLVTDRTLPPLKVTMVDAMDMGRLRTWADEKRAGTAPATETHDGVAWENRVISMNMDNLQWMKRIGAYEYLERHRMRPMERIRVWDGLTDAAVEFGGAHGTALSSMVEISNIQQALLRFVADRAADGTSAVDVEIYDRARVQSIDAAHASAAPVATLQRGDEPPRHVAARLLVGADGHNSPVRQFAGIESFGWSYGCKGLVATVRTGVAPRAEPTVDATGWQRFLPTGTLAFLPLSPRSGTIVWALPPALSDALGAMHREASAAGEGAPEVLATLVSAGLRLPWVALEPLLQEAAALVQQGDGDWRAFQARIVALVEAAEQEAGARAPSAHLGIVPPWADTVDVKSVASFPLQLKHAGCYLGSSLNEPSSTSPSALLGGALTAVGLTPGGAARGEGQARTVLVGDAAHTTHPLAGQGMNLGVQDVRALHDTIADACQHGMDIGTHAALHPYERARYLPNQAMLSVTDHLHWLFAQRPVSPWAPSSAARTAALNALVWVRSTGMDVVNELTPLKSFFARGAGSV